ncbi:nonribosomal peptide synthetase MxaA [Paenibacillus sp. PCH8]|uniref:alpha/beta fold hydrolase n=1 Tax=Paenibacillus sp. PCH8 TaxID=2066524 RepID=UPI000CF9FBB6|nr:alpha/beta fold hydrolase [Paenibacillus sp. PCH8]PQP83629.1 nonribosomal peptide synthetase MxaA [Paenibacillus sp. PCH8]
MNVHTSHAANKESTDNENITNITQRIHKTFAGPNIIFMTGGTGFIGKETVKRFADENAQLLLLVRSEQRARAVMKAYGVKDLDRITFITGDLSIPGLGLTAADRGRVLEADVIIHAGGTMDVTLGREIAEQIFMNGAKEVGQLAQEIHRIHGLKHFIHVVGFMSPYGQRNEQGDYLQVDHTGNQESAYEEMKFQADLHIREHAEQHNYPLSVVNPSTVVGPRPTGVTEQTGGIGLLIQAIQKRLMPVVPGGSSYWLPLVENDVVAQTLVFLSKETAPVGGTYPLLARKEDSPNMNELLHLLAEQLDVPKPKWAVPLPWIQWAMRSGGTRISGVPAESVAFISNRSFPVEETEALFTRMGQSWPDIREQLPFVTADLDYRLQYTPLPEDFPADYIRARGGDMAMVGWEGEGEPWIMVHGLLQSADEMLPLGRRLRELTGNPVWMVDLAGFGRSPVHQGDEVFEGQIDALVTALHEFKGPLKLVGHSIGAAIAAAALKRSRRTDIRLGLLQPVANNANPNMLAWMSRLPRGVVRTLLRRRSERSWARMFSTYSGREGNLVMEHAMARRIRSNLQSPRIAGAHADLLRWIHSGQRGSVISSSWMKNGNPRHAGDTLVVWAKQDQEYHYPKDMDPQMKRIDVPYGHYFPVFQYRETAAILAEWSDTRT